MVYVGFEFFLVDIKTCVLVTAQSAVGKPRVQRLAGGLIRFFAARQLRRMTLCGFLSKNAARSASLVMSYGGQVSSFASPADFVYRMA